MKKILIVLIVTIAFSMAGNAQTTQPNNQSAETDYPITTIGLSGGLDYNTNAYHLAPTSNGGKYFSENPRYNIGADVGIQLTKRLRPRFEMKYVNVKYGIDWSSFSNIDKTIVNVDYFDFNFRLDFLLLPIKKFELFISPAFKYEFETGNSVLNNYNMPIDLIHHPSSIIGGGISGIFKYNITEHFGVTLTPELTYFVHSFATGNDKPYQRTSYNFGFEYKF